MTSKPRALVVRGGWDGHDPVGCTEAVIARVSDRYDIDVAASFDAYSSTQELLGYDLIVQCWSMGSLTPEQESALVGAVEAGVGFAGWHGGVIGTCVANARYLRMVGGRFVWHPDGFQHYRVTIRPDERDHVIVAGLGDYDVETEQYWVLNDSADHVLATCVFEPDPGGQWHTPAEMPVAWTREWGQGRVFVCTLGHCTADLEVPQTIAMIDRGLGWATRTYRPAAPAAR